MSGGGDSFTAIQHICGITNDGKLWITSKLLPADGSPPSWTAWKEVKAEHGVNPGPFVNAACVRTQNHDEHEEVHVLGITSDGKLWYTNRVEQGDWLPFEDLTALIGDDLGQFLQVGVTNWLRTLDAFVIVRTKEGQQRIVHTSRPDDGTDWQKFEDINLPELAGFPGSFVSVDCTYLWVPLLVLLHVCAVTENGKLWHTIRFANPLWLPFGNVQLLSQNAPESVVNVSLAPDSRDLDVFAQSNGDLWHTTRLSSIPPAWQPAFEDISQEAQAPGSFVSIACDRVADDTGTSFLHAYGVTQDGRLWHTSRASNSPTWQPFEDMTTIVGSPGSFTFVCLAKSVPTPAAGGADTTCQAIEAALSNDQSLLPVLQQQGADSRQIAALEQEISSLQQQGQQKGCF